MAELTVPRVDFSSLGDLPQIWKQGRQDAMRQQTLASLGQGTDLDANALLKSGDLSLAQLGVAMRTRSSDDIWRQQEAQRAQQNADRSYKLQERSADRADEPTPTNFVKDETVPGGYRPIGPADPDYQEKLAAAKARAAALTPPEGFTRNSAGALSPIVGGPQDPNYIGAAEGAKAKAKAAAGGDSPEYGLSPVWGVGADGKPALVQLSKNGKTLQPQLPEGFQISKDPIKIDAGTHYNLLDPQTRQIIGSIPKNVAEVERQKVVGDEVAKAQKNYPQNIAAAQQILKTISDIENDPALPNSVGSWGAIPAFPGSPGANFNAKAAQLKGQTFLQAYSQLKGGGAITDIEGAKGENAIARLDKAQNEKEYRAALKDFRKVIQGGMLRSAAMARGDIGPPKEEPIDPEVLAGRKSGPTGPTVETTPGKSGVVSYTDYFRQ